MGWEAKHLRGEVKATLRRRREGTVVSLSDPKEGEKTIWVPTWNVSVGDTVDGVFYPQSQVWIPVRPEAVQVYPSGEDPVRRELGQVVYSVLPALGYGRSLALGRMEEAFDYLLLRKPLDSLFAPGEYRERREAEEGLREWHWFFEALEELLRLGFTPMEGYWALSALGVEALDLAGRNPFLLAQVDGVEYLRLVSRFGRHDPVGDALHRLKERYWREGSTLFPQEVLGEEGERVLEASFGQIRGERGWVGLRRYIEQEVEVWENLQGRSRLPALAPSGELGPDQMEAAGLTQHRVAVLTGGPGTGKTYTVSRLVRAAVERGIPVALIAPTGKAARRLEEVSGLPAKTLHSQLGVRPHEGFSSSRPLPQGLVVLDEASMLSLENAVRVLRALPQGASLLLVGDVDQLPPVEPGQPFADLLRLAPSVRLSQVRRQKDPASGLLEAARRALEGRGWTEVLARRPKDLLYVRAKDAREALRWAKLLVRLYLQAGLGPEEVQVLTPVHEGSLGTRALNSALRELYPKKAQDGVLLGDGHMAMVGEKIIFAENKPLLGVANGTMGVLEGVDDTTMLVRAGGGYLEVPRALGHLATLGYAITVHRSQGSEWKAVVLVVPESGLVTRRLVYTALTRAKEQVAVVSLWDMERHPLPEDKGRRTWLGLLAPGLS